MAHPVDFEGSNLTLRGNGADIADMPVHYNKDTGVITGCWQLSAEEVQQVMKDGKVFMQYGGGRAIPTYCGRTLPSPVPQAPEVPSEPQLVHWDSD